MSLFKRKQKEIEIPVYPFGYAMAQQPDTKCSNQAIICAFKGFLIFAATFGTIGSVISSFSLPCHLFIIFAVLLLLSMGLSFMHYNRIVFNICYPILFFAFAYMIFQFRLQVNSGFQAFVSIMQKEYSDYYDLSIYREVTEAYTDRTMTITFAALFIGFFFGILLNIAISEYMSILMVFLMTFPVLQLGIFIKLQPDMPYLVLLLFSYFSVYLMKRGQHFLLPYRDKKKTDFKYTETRNLIQHRYHASGKTIAQISIMLFLFCLICGIIWLPFTALSQTDAKRTKLRVKADDYMEIYVQSGLSGLFNRYEAKGGISGGKLGGVSGVRPDYETDLTLTFVPTSYEPLYLKAYTGSVYTGDSFLPAYYDTAMITPDVGEDYASYNQYTAFLESKRLEHHTKNAKGIFSKMKIENLDADEDHMYYPYYTANISDIDYTIDRSVISGAAAIGSSYSVDYYPLIHDYWKIDSSPDALVQYYGPDHQNSAWIQYYDMQSIIHNLDVPDELKAYIETIKEDIGYSIDTGEQIRMIRDYLSDNYTYNMSPGTTPRNADFVQHFLEKQKRGYCSHFAAAATMLLRSYGIPARYVEGYCVSFREITEGFAVEEDYDKWLEGENPLGKTGVLSVNVTDADAHAWVEAYISGFGWIPYEFTPSSSDQSVNENRSEFWDLFTGLFRGPQNNSNNLNQTTTSADQIETSHRQRLDTLVRESFLKPLILFIVLVGLIVVLVLSIRTILPILQMKRAFSAGQPQELISYRYRRICRRYQRLGLTDDIILPSDFATGEFLHQTLAAAYTPELISRYMDILQHCLFSGTDITKKEADDLLLFLTTYDKQLRKYTYKCKR